MVFEIEVTVSFTVFVFGSVIVDWAINKTSHVKYALETVYHGSHFILSSEKIAFEAILPHIERLRFSGELVYEERKSILSFFSEF